MKNVANPLVSEGESPAPSSAPPRSVPSAEVSSEPAPTVEARQDEDSSVDRSTRLRDLKRASAPSVESEKWCKNQKERSSDALRGSPLVVNDTGGGGSGSIAPLEVIGKTSGGKSNSAGETSDVRKKRKNKNSLMIRGFKESAVLAGKHLLTHASQQKLSVPIEQNDITAEMSPRIVKHHAPPINRDSMSSMGSDMPQDLPGYSVSAIGHGSGVNHLFRAKAQYRVHALYLSFIGDSSIEEFEHMYQRHHDLERLPSIRKFVTLLTLIFIAYLTQTYLSHPGQWDYHFFVVFLTCFCFMGLLVLSYKGGEIVIPKSLQKRSRLQRFMSFSIFVVCLMHMLRALQNRKDIGYAWTMSYLPCLYISTMATVIGLRFVYFFPTAIAILVVHIILVYLIRPAYRGDQLEIVKRVSTTLWMYDAVTLVIFSYVSRNLEYASRKAFVQLRTLMDVNIDVRMDSDSRIIEGMFQSSAAKKVLRAIGGTDWVIRWQDLVLGEKFAAG
eukprot:g326.t1